MRHRARGHVIRLARDTMSKVNFTAARVDAHHCPEGKSQAFLWDAVSPGLGLRATAGGAKSYIFQGKIHGQTIRLTIGDPRSWTIGKAQEEARRLQILIDADQDPREVKAEQRASYEARQAAALRKVRLFPTHGPTTSTTCAPKSPRKPGNRGRRPISTTISSWRPQAEPRPNAAASRLSAARYIR